MYRRDRPTRTGATMTTAIRCGTLIDGTGSDPVRNVTLVLDDTTIVDVKRDGEVPHDAEVIDAGHLTVMPGMIDCHVHLGSSTWGLQERLLIPFSLIVAHALNHARITLENVSDVASELLGQAALQAKLLAQLLDALLGRQVAQGDNANQTMLAREHGYAADLLVLHHLRRFGHVLVFEAIHQVLRHRFGDRRRARILAN